MFESGISNDVGDDVGDTGNACIRGAGVSNISVEDIGAGSDGVEDKEEDLETLMARMTRRMAAMCPPNVGEGTNSARHASWQNNPSQSLKAQSPSPCERRGPMMTRWLARHPWSQA